MFKAIFDAGPLITACRFAVQGRLVLDHLLDECQIAIPPSVQTEVMVAGRRFPDAQEAQQRVSTGEIQVVTPPSLSGNTPAILDLYELGDGERDAILLTYHAKWLDALLVMDDYLGYMVSDRLGVRKLFLLDLILQMVREGDTSRALATEIVKAIRPRYALGCVEHTLLLLR